MKLTEYVKFYADRDPGTKVVSAIKGRQGSWRGAKTPGPSPYFEDMTIDDFSDLLQGDNADFQEFRKKVADKWAGPQGIPPTAEQASALLAPFYNPSRRIIPLHGVELEVYRYLINDIVEEARYSGWINYDNLSAVTTIDKQQGNSGWRYFTSDPDILTANRAQLQRIATQVYWDDTLELDPVIQWWRFQKNKLRSIHGDSITNLAAERTALERMLNTYEKLCPQIAYRSEDALGNEQARWTARHPDAVAVEIDVTHMDEGVHENHAQLVLDYNFSWVPTSKADRRRIRSMVHRVFSQPVVDLNCDVREGIHALLSGVYMTNGIENYVSLMAVARFICTVAKQAHIDPRELIVHCLVYVKGDDVIIFLPWPVGDVSTYADIAVSVYESLALEANTGKQRVSTSSGFFCKYQYPCRDIKGWKRSKTGGIIPRYPFDLAFNSAKYPEHGVATTLAGKLETYSPEAELGVVCSKLDNSYGDWAWEACVTRWYNAKRTLIRDNLKAMLKSDYHIRNWRQKVYGAEVWTPQTSPTVRLLMTLMSRDIRR